MSKPKLLMFPQTCSSFCLPLSVLSNSLLVTLSRGFRVILMAFSLILLLQSLRRACWAQLLKSVWPLSTSHQFPACPRPCVAGLPDFYPCLLLFFSQCISQVVLVKYTPDTTTLLLKIIQVAAYLTPSQR